MASRPLVPRVAAEPGPKRRLKPVRVLIALQSPMDCHLLHTAIERARVPLDVVACAVSCRDCLPYISQKDVDVALVNVDLEDGPMAGFDLLSELTPYYDKTAAVMLFDTWKDELILRAFSAGASGVFCRREPDLSLLWRCISAVNQGQVWANSDQLHLLLKALRNPIPVRALTGAGLKLLAAREAQVADLVAEGLPNKEIAAKIGVTEHTVSNYLFRIYNKLGVSNRVELALYVMKERQESSAGNQQPEKEPAKTAKLFD